MIGHMLGHYRIESKLGEGGMGVVYRARDERLERDVALKALPAGTLADETARRRFRKEALTLSQINHPNIATVYDFDTQESIDFLVLELIPGVTLDEKLAAGPLAEKEVLRVGAQLAQGLAAAHERGVVHRDLKPGNLRVTPDGRLKILDFGLATLLRPEGEPASTVSMTATQAVVGTLPYMAPEQLRGEKADARSDIYAAGVVLYEMATGRRPFSETQGPQLVAAILQQAPEVPTSVNRRVSPGLENIILKALDKEPERRYQSAKELLVDLERLTTPSASSAPSRDLPRRRIGVLAVALLALAVALYLFPWRGNPVDSLAVLPFANASGNPEMEYLSDGLAESLIDSLSQLPGLKVMSRSSVFRYKGREVDARTAGHELGVRAVLTGRIALRGENLSVSTELVDTRDNSHLWGERYNRKLADALAVQEEIAKQISGRLRLRLSREQKARLAKRQTENPEAYQLYLKGRYHAFKFTTEELAKGLEYFRQAIALDPTYALAYDGIAYYYNLVVDWTIPPAEAMPKAKEAARKALELDDTLAEAHTSLACVYFFYDWDWPAAEREFRRALDLNPDYAIAHTYYGWYLVWMGRTDEGLAENRRGEALDPLSSETSLLLGWGLYYAQRYDQAIAQFSKTLDLDPNSWPACVFVGQAYEQKDQFPEAIAALQKARQIEDQILVPLAALARAYAVSGRRAEARQTLEELLARAKRHHVSAYTVATIYTGLRDKDQAFAWLEKAYEDRSWYMASLKVDPQLDALRSDPRFSSLLRRMNLAP